MQDDGWFCHGQNFNSEGLAIQELAETRAEGFLARVQQSDSSACCRWRALFRLRHYTGVGQSGGRGRIYSFHFFRGEEAVRTEMLIRKSLSYGRCRSAHLRRYCLGASPISRLNTRLKELSDPYPMADATSEKDILFERIIAPALYIRQRVRYSSGVRPKMVLNFKAKADLDMRASRASDSTDQLLSNPACIACIALPRCLSDIAANHPFGGASELLA